MNKIILLTLAIVLCFFITSCKNDTSLKINSNHENADTNIEVPNETNEYAEIKEDDEIKPSSSEEIIDYANKLNVDVSIKNFDLSGILTNTQPSLTPDAGDDYQNSTAYLGDSVTLGLSFFENHPSDLVIAKGSINPLDATDKKLIETPSGEMVNFPDALSMTNAKRAVLTFGSNAVSVMSEETFLNYYSKLIDAVREKNPDCDIIIQSITPLATTCTLKKLTNTLINRSNLLLLVLAYSKDVKFLNSAPILKDEDGYLKIEYCSSDDGIHINEKGYEAWIDYLRTHAIAE